MQRGDKHRASKVSTTSMISVALEGACMVDPSTSRGRKLQVLQMAGFPLIPGIVLVIFSVTQLVVYSYRLSTANQMESLILRQQDVLELTNRIREEGGAATVFAASNGSLEVTDLNAAYVDTDHQAEELHWPSGGIGNYIDAEHLVNALRQHRIILDPYEDLGEQRHMAFYQDVLESFTVWFLEACTLKDLRDIWHQLDAIAELYKTIDNLWVQALLGSIYYSVGTMSRSQHVLFLEHMYLEEEHIERAVLAEQQLNDIYRVWVMENTEFMNSLAEQRAVIGQNKLTPSDMTKTKTWYLSEKYYAYILSGMMSDILQDALDTLQAIKTPCISVITWDVLIICFVCGVMIPVVTWSADSVTTSLHVYERIMEGKSTELRKEKRKTERLLNQMLPKAVAYRLKKGEDVGADHFEEVTIYFSDIADFSEISSLCAPMQIVVFLNDLYNFMDARIELFDVYKVETIGAVYMVVSGLPSRNGKRHASEIARLGLDLLEATKSFHPPNMADRMLQLRIGAHTGPVVAGVVGNKMPRYCLFGDTVNTASRMQSNGDNRRFHISGALRDRLQDIGGFGIETRGVITIKGKGEMTTHWLNSYNKPTRRGSVLTTTDTTASSGNSVVHRISVATETNSRADSIIE